MYEFWYDYVSPKYVDRAKLCYTDTGSFIIYIKTKDFFEDISNDVKKWFDASNCSNKKVPGLFKDELGGKIIKEFAALRGKAYAYLDDCGNEHKISKGTKRCVIKQKTIFQNYKDCLLNNKTIYRSQERFKSYNHDAIQKK